MTPKIDLHLDRSLSWEDFSNQAMSIVTLRNGNRCWTPWVHQSRFEKWDCELRHSSGDEAPYTRDGIYCGAERGYDIVAIERGIDPDEARSRGLTKLDWPGASA
jgi:hypothetical protein